MDRPRTGYYRDPYGMYPDQHLATYAAPSDSSAGKGYVFIRQKAESSRPPLPDSQSQFVEASQRVQYYRQDLPVPEAMRPPVERYYIQEQPISSRTEAPRTTRPSTAAEYYIQRTIAPAGAAPQAPRDPPGVAAPTVEYHYVQTTAVPPVRKDVSTYPVPLPVGGRPPGDYYHVESVPQRNIPVSSTGVYPTLPISNHTSSSSSSGGDGVAPKLIAYERYVVPASSDFKYDPTVSRDYLAPTFQRPQPYGYQDPRMERTNYLPADVVDDFQRLQMRDYARGANEVAYVTRREGDILTKDPALWRPVGKLSTENCKKCSRK